ncbi:hypothetical protein EBO15_16625 [Actinomadura harenae]|uniref:Uncharacterized protein n=1 Tax=Actinomadura harenae TaxID=2483351 RepID=A0A3M2M1A1_9ACTN|nr:hypothetical protein EBO15_16625 [Actinomadura harenae]
MTVETRKILEIKPGRTWLVVLDGRWAYDAPPDHHAVPLDVASVWLLLWSNGPVTRSNPKPSRSFARTTRTSPSRCGP